MGETLTGRRIGNYDVRDLLGSGGMASVYRGYDPALDREVAIKLIATADQSADFVARFQREARVVARLRHPNIVQIYQFGEEPGFVYMVQELLPGPTLQRKLKDARRRMVPARLHEVVGHLAAALDFAHGQGVIHRDVKPSNAIANAHGQFILTDFGIARTEADKQRTVTGPGIVMGTPHYLAPEQAVSSVALTPACDIYALGVVAFELLTGKLPFNDASAMGVIIKHLYDDPPKPSSLRAELPKAVDVVVLRAMAKEPRQRYTSAGAFAKALAEALPAKLDEGTKPQPRRTPSSSTIAAKTTPKPTAKPRHAAPIEATLKPVRTRHSAPDSPQRPPTPANTVAVPSQHHIGRSLLVGLLTLITVGVLIVYGINPTLFTTAWQNVVSLLNR